MKLNWGLIGALLFSVMVWTAVIYAAFYMPVAFIFGIMAVMLASLIILSRR